MSEPEEKFCQKFVLESDAIEGIGPLPDDVRSTDGHEAIIVSLDELARAKQYRFTESDICYIQYKIVFEQHLKPGGLKLKQKYIGRYRDCTVYVGNRLCPAPASVPSMMKRLIEDVGVWQDLIRSVRKSFSAEQLIPQIADFHLDYEHIHPFADGNGRSGRALVYYLFRFADLQPFIFTSNDRRETYYPAFAGRELMRDYFLKKYKG